MDHADDRSPIFTAIPPTPSAALAVVGATPVAVGLVAAVVVVPARRLATLQRAPERRDAIEDRRRSLAGLFQ